MPVVRFLCAVLARLADGCLCVLVKVEEYRRSSSKREKLVKSMAFVKQSGRKVRDGLFKGVVSGSSYGLL